MKQKWKKNCDEIYAARVRNSSARIVLEVFWKMRFQTENDLIKNSSKKSAERSDRTQGNAGGFDNYRRRQSRATKPILEKFVIER